MAVPTWDEMIRPILEAALGRDITRRDAYALMCDHFNLSDSQRQERLPSGGLRVANRAGWAITHLSKGGLIEKVKRGTYRITERGKEFLDSHPGPVSCQTLKVDVPEYQQAWQEAMELKAEKRADEVSESEETASESTTTPEEAIDRAVNAITTSLRSELMTQLREIDPYRFEQVVLDVLSAMGYGGSRQEAAEVTKKSNDEGIDGVINEDRLGLDVIYVQAKRWQNTVGRKEIQSFVGALAGKQAVKGVFITTSDFNRNAMEYAHMVTQKIILIDGKRLADLMIEYQIGVSATRTITLKRLDSDYFEDE
ncbi:MAG: restriction endonuclease [Kiritimatiellia bacterium]